MILMPLLKPETRHYVLILFTSLVNTTSKWMMEDESVLPDIQASRSINCSVWLVAVSLLEQTDTTLGHGT